MKYFYRFRRILCLTLAIILMMPSNLPSILHATTGNSDNTSSVVSEVDVDENTSSVSSEEITMESEDTALPEGFQLHIEWDDSEFKDGTAYNIIEDTNTNNSVKLRVSYSNNQVSETGYQPGELIITVKGIGALNRSGTVEAQVGADKASASTKNREWSYTWSKTKDTYTFTNNKTIEPNTVLSGYFDILWTFNSKNTIHEYYQDDICAELLLPDGNSKQSETLSISNSTICDEYTIDIDKAPLYSSSGVAGNIIDYEKFTFIKYSLTSYLNNKSRGVNEDKETFIFDTDCTDIGNGGIITYSNIAYSSLEEGLYEVSLKNNQTVGNQYVIVAYPKETYLGKQTTASITSYGTYFEGDNEGNFDEEQLATDSIEFAMPADFDFEDTGGLFHELKESDYEQLIYKDKKFNDKFIKNGGHLQGQRMYLGTTESFYLGFSIDYPPAKDTHYSIEFIDDFLYIAQNNGNYRQLTYEDYEIKDVVILSTKNVFNENNVNVQHGVYPVKVYALQNGNLFTREQNSPEGFYENESALVWEGLWENYDQKIALPAGTNTVLIRIENLTEALYPTWTGQQNFEIYEPIVKLNIKFHLDEENLPEDEKANLSEGQLVNTMYLNYYDTNKTLINYDDNEEDYLDEDINLDLAQIDLDTYGRYLDRDKGSFSFYAGEKSDYKAYTDLSNITQKGKIFTAKMTIGADFDYAEEETPNKFSLYTVLPENVSLHNYELEEDLWDILTFSGMDLDADTLATHCSVEIDENYQNSGRTYIALHFDFKENPLPKLTNIRVAFTVKIDKNYFKQSKSTVNVKSVVKIDDVINSYNIGKVNDDGLWDTDSALLSDIDKNGETLELIAYNYDFSTYTYVDSSELQITKSIKTSSIEDFIQLPEVPLAEQGSLYTYELTVKNGNNTSTDLIITDILENGNNSEWKGTFDSINLSEADKLGMTYTIYYATKSDIGTLGEDSNWQIYDEANTDKAQIKAITIDFGTSVLDIGKELNIYINMIAPSENSLKDKITENNFNISFTMTSVSGNDTQTSYNSLDSNYVQAKLTAPLKNLVLTKVDEENHSILSGAKYSLIEKDTQKLIAQGITNSRGQITFKDIPSDKTYVLREDEAPQGYELGENYEFTFNENKTLRITLSDKRKTGTIELIKRNYLDNLLMVEGAEFTLFNMDGTEIQKAVTNINGKAVFENIPWGEYYLQETTAPDGYILDETIYNVKITRENVHEIQKFTMTNTQDGSTLIILNKYVMTSSGVQTDIPLQGAVFELVRVTGGQSNVLGTYVTDKNGEIIIEDLAYGDYILREARVPTGYYKTENIAVTLSPANKEASLIAYDKRKPGSINIFKKDNLDNIVEGAVFELYDETKNNVLGTYTTDASGNIFINDLEWETYYLREKSTLDCYKLNQEWIEIVIDGNTLDIDLTCINETKKGTIVLTKTDELGYPITNNSAEFALYNADGTLLQEGLTTDENGELRVENLEWGNYYFKETKAPIGYGLTDETIRFAVNSMNAGVEQSIYVSDPVKSKTITITKKIFVDDINFENGDPTFLFKVNGTDISDKEHTYYRIIRFDKNYVEANTDEEGYVSQSVTVSGIIAGIYNITEEESSRYVLDLVETSSSNTSISQKVATTDLTFEDYGDATFTNIKYEHNGFSDNKSLANSLKVQTKLTGLKATWLGEPEVEVYTEIDRNLVEVTALYDDGTFKKLNSEEWAFGDSFEGSSFPNINGIYYIPVTYTENGITKTASFEITLYGAIKEKIIRLEAAVKDEYSTLPPNYALSPDMFNVTAIYNDGSKEKITTAQSSNVIKSPNYPNNYSNNMTESKNSWIASFPGATSLKIVFSSDSRLESSSYDYVTIYNKNGTKIAGGKSSTLGGTSIANQTITVSGDYARLTMVSDSSGTYKGFLATIYPLDENGNVIPNEANIIISPERTSFEEGISEIEISLNKKLYTEDVSTTVNIFTKNYEPLLIKGEDFRSQIPSSATSILFTDEEAPAGADITDLSLEKNRSVSAWLDGTTWKVSTQRKGVKSIAHENCQLMFSNSKLISIDCTYLDTSRVTSMYQMFNDCTSLTTLDIGGFNTSNVTNMSYMFCYCSKLTSLDVSSFNTSKVTDMSNMFDKSGLVSLDLSNFDTSNVTDMFWMFYICDDLVNLNLSNFNTSKVTDMGYMFNGCRSLKSLDLQSFDTTKVNCMASMFSGCSSLKSLDLSNFNTSGLINSTNPYGIMGGIFNSCYQLERITLSNTFEFIGTNCYLPTNYSGYWYNIETGEKYISNEIPNNTAATYVCVSPEYTDTLTVSMAHYIPSTVTKIIFTNTTIPNDAITYDLSAAQDGTILGWTTGTNFYISSTKANTKVVAHRNCDSMFESLSKLTSIDFSYLDTSNAISMNNMFSGCTKLTSLDLSALNTSNVTSMNGIFNRCSALTSLDLSSLDTSNVTSMNNMFSGCSKLTSLDLSSLNTTNVTSMNGMFSNCSSLTTLDVSSLDTSNVTDMGNIFASLGKSSAYITIIGLDKLNTTNVTNMNGMFKSTYISSIDLSGLDTSNVTDMGSMFSYCKMTSLNVNTIDTSNVTNMSRMFENCSALTSLDLSNFDTSSVTNMYYMFANCSALTSLDLSNFDTSNVTNMDNMFYYCNSLTSLDVSNFNTSNVTDMMYMFRYCSSLTSLDVSSFNTANVTDMNNMFGNCSSLTSLDVSSFNTSNVTDMYGMFSYCSSLTTLDLSSFDTPNLTDMYGMFSNCTSLSYLDVSNFDVPENQEETNMFYNVNSLNTVVLGSNWTLTLPSCRATGAVAWHHKDTLERYVPKSTPTPGTYIAVFNNMLLEGMDFNELIPNNATSIVFTDIIAPANATLTDVSNTSDYSVVAWLDNDIWYVSTQKEGELIRINPDCRWMFEDKTSLVSIDFSNLDTTLAYWMNGMFDGCSSLNTLDLSNFNTPNATSMNSMFFGCSSLTNLDVSGFDTSGITSTKDMFYNCSSLTNLDLNNFDTTNVTNMSYMFYGCNSLANLDLSSFDTSNVTNMSYMFYGCSSLADLDLSSFDTSNVTNMSYMFDGDSSLIALDLSSFNVAKTTNMTNMFNGCTSIIDGNAYARSIADTDKLNASTNKPITWYFNSVAPLIQITLDNKCPESITVDFPDTIEGGITEIPLTCILENKAVSYFKLNGKLIKGSSFIAPLNSSTITISDVILTDQIVLETSHNPFNSDDTYRKVVFEGASSLTVVLTSQSGSGNYIDIYGTDIGRFSTYSLTTTTYIIEGDTFSIGMKLTSSTNYYGYKAVVTANYDYPTED